mgnify:CR=1 FL=1
MNYYKYDEIVEVLTDWLIETQRHQGKDFGDYVAKLIVDGDLHHEVYNTDYFIIGTYQAEQWMGSKLHEIIGIIYEYEKDNFGEVLTDLSCPERVVNMYSYIVGEQVIADYVNQFDLNDYEDDDLDDEPEQEQVLNYLEGKFDPDNKNNIQITTPKEQFPANWRELPIFVDGSFYKQRG